MRPPLPPAAYWERRYATGRSSGATNEGLEGAWKVARVNAFLSDYRVESVLDLGCGDGLIAMQLTVPRYVGYDPSPSAIARCRRRLPGRRFTTDPPTEPAQATLSLDVLYHLVEDDAYRAYLALLFGLAERWVVVYGTNAEGCGPPHVRHRTWLPDVPAGWRLFNAEQGAFKTLWVLARD